MSLQHRAILSIATFWAAHAGLELCPKHTLEKLAQDEKMISSLSAERERLEDKLKGAAIREKLLIEEKEKIRADLKKLNREWFEEAMRLRKVIKRQDQVSFNLGFLGILTFFIGVWVGGNL